MKITQRSSVKLKRGTKGTRKCAAVAQGYILSVVTAESVSAYYAVVKHM